MEERVFEMEHCQSSKHYDLHFLELQEEGEHQTIQVPLGTTEARLGQKGTCSHMHILYAELLRR